MNVIIAGSRSFTDFVTLASKCDRILSQQTEPVTVISGGARGADGLGEWYARTRCYPVRKFEADFKQYGRSAGYKRNVVMAGVADALIAFWDGDSRGTRHMIETMEKLGKPVRVVRFS